MASSSRFEINRVGVERLLAARGDTPATRFMLRRARVVQREARRMAPGRRMAPKIRAVIVDDHVRIESTHDATLFVIKGTRPHIIRPVRRQYLKFSVRGKTVFAKIVHHPGTKANDFLTKALRMAQR